MLIGPKDLESIKEKKITLVKNFLTLEKNYDFNFISSLLEENHLEVLQPTQHPPLKNIYHIKSVSSSVKEFAIFFDFLKKLFKYEIDNRDEVDLFISLITQTGVPHVDIEDVFIIGLEGRLIYRTYEEKEKDYEICKGDLIFIPRGLKHKVIGLSPRVIASIGFYGKIGVDKIPH